MSLYIPYSLVVQIHATAFEAWWHQFVSGLEQFGFLERKQEIARRLNLAVRNILTSPGKRLGVGFEYAEVQVKSFLLTSGHITKRSY